MERQVETWRMEEEQKEREEDPLLVKTASITCGSLLQWRSWR